jgi:outer membrane protein assembly factor BamB
MSRHLPGHSITVDGDNLILLTAGPHTLVVALNKLTGETVWKSASAGSEHGYSTPYFFEFEGTRVVAVVSNSNFVGLAPETGRTLFSIPWRGPQHCPMPIYRDGHLFLTTDQVGARGFRLSKNDDGTLTLTETWFEERFAGLHHGFILIDDHVYGTTRNGEWGAINFLTGEISYLVRPVGERGSIHYADGLLYVLAENSTTVILWKPCPEEFIEVSRFELPNDARGPAWALPVVIGGKLYLRHAQYLYCYDVRAE